MAIPSKELIGQNPKIVEGNYSDDYVAALNKFASVDEVFGKHRKAITEGESNPIAKLVMDTLGKAEYENHLVAIVMTAAKVGEWRAVQRGCAQMCGLEIVAKKQFGHVITYRDKTFLLPTALYLTYCKEQLE